MKYFKIDIKTLYTEKNRIASSAEGEKILNGEEYFNMMKAGEIIPDTPIFDFFYLKSYDKKEYWEWLLTDSYDFIGEGSQIPGWLISKKLKMLLEKFKIAEPHFYYSSKLLYEKEKLDYYIFQFSGKNFRIPLTNYIDFNQSIFYDPNNSTDITVQNERELLFQQGKILEESGFDIINVPVKRLILTDNIDFISMQNFLGDKIVSERLKEAIEENGITGFEFKELDYEVIIE